MEPRGLKTYLPYDPATQLLEITEEMKTACERIICIPVFAKHLNVKLTKMSIKW